jgi:hypothetical protein
MIKPIIIPAGKETGMPYMAEMMNMAIITIPMVTKILKEVQPAEIPTIVFSRAILKL